MKRWREMEMANPSKRKADNPIKDELALIPHIRVDFGVYGYHGFHKVGGHYAEFINLIVKFLYDFKVEIRDNDIEYRTIDEQEQQQPQKVVEGRLVFRDLDDLPSRCGIANPNPKISEMRSFLVEKLSSFFTQFPLSCGFKILPFIPASEDADVMMSLLPHHDPLPPPPPMVVKGVPSHWFADHPDFFQPSKDRLHAFFGKFGLIMDLDTSENEVYSKYCNVTIQYANFVDCRKALERLCSYSLIRVRESKIEKAKFDYEVTWKDKRDHMS